MSTSQSAVTLVMAVLALTLSRSTTAQTYSNPANGHDYTLTSAPSDVHTARAEAVALGGYLVAINDAAENAFVVATFNSFLSGLGTDAWIGLSDACNEGTYVWDSGEAYNYHNFLAGEPNNFQQCGGVGGEDFVAIRTWQANGDWNDLPTKPSAGAPVLCPGGGVCSAAGNWYGIIEIPVPPKALGIANANGYVSVASRPDLEPCSGLTVEAWVYYDPSLVAGGNGSRTIVRKGPVHPFSPYNLRVYDVTGQLNWAVGTSIGGIQSILDPTVFPTLTWTHVAGTFDGSVMALFVNGILVASQSASGTLVSGGELRIGKGEDGFPEFWGGLIDEVRIWNFARTAGEITGGMTHAHEVGNLPGTVGVWNLNGNLTDRTGNHNGVAVSGPTFTTTGAPLVGEFISSFSFGAASPLVCAPGLPTAAITSLPKAWTGNPDFALVSSCAPPFGLGFIVVSTAALASPFTIFGVDLWVPVVGPNYLTVFTVAADGAGLLRAPVPLGPFNASGLLGLNLDLQFVWFGGCQVGGLIASNAMHLAFVP